MELLIVKLIALVGGSLAAGYGAKNVRLWFKDKASDVKEFIGDVREVRKKNAAD